MHQNGRKLIINWFRIFPDQSIFEVMNRTICYYTITHQMKWGCTKLRYVSANVAWKVLWNIQYLPLTTFKLICSWKPKSSFGISIFNSNSFKGFGVSLLLKEQINCSKMFWFFLRFKVENIWSAICLVVNVVKWFLVILGFVSFILIVTVIFYVKREIANG